MKRADYDKAFAARIIAQIKAGTAPWQKPWEPGVRSAPFNIASRKRYNGSNAIYLAAAQGGSPTSAETAPTTTSGGTGS